MSNVSPTLPPVASDTNANANANAGIAKSALPSLIIASKNYSSWSMRPWVLLTQFGIPFDEHVIALGQTDTAVHIAAFSPSGRLPCWIDGDYVVWDSLAICETLAERYPAHALWPRDPVQRARARAVSAEMHSGFGAVRNAMPMNIRGRASERVWRDDVLDDIARIDTLWTSCLATGEDAARETQDGTGAVESGFLFGAFSIADAMFVPIAMRFNTYPVRLSAAASAYVARLTALPSVQSWMRTAMAEPAIDYYDVVL